MQWKVSSRILNVMRSFTGSQCKLRKIGVMRAYLGDSDTMRAAAFCSFWSFDIEIWGKLTRRAFPKSNRDEINAWTNFSVADLDKYFLIKPMLRNWYLIDLHICEIWLAIVMCESNIKPRLRQESDRLTVWFENEIESMEILLRCAFEPNMRNSHLSVLSLREWESIHCWMSTMHDLRRFTALSAAVWLLLKETISWISSAYLW